MITVSQNIIKSIVMIISDPRLENKITVTFFSSDHHRSYAATEVRIQ